MADEKFLGEQLTDAQLDNVAGGTGGPDHEVEVVNPPTVKPPIIPPSKPGGEVDVIHPCGPCATDIITDECIS